MSEILSVFGVNWKLILIQTVNFAVLLAILWRFLYRPLMKMLDERKALVDKGIDDAKKAEEELGKIEHVRKESEKHALIKSEALLKEAKNRAALVEKETVNKAEERGARIVAEATRTAEGEKERILKESEKELARIAILGAEKILREKSL